MPNRFWDRGSLRVVLLGDTLSMKSHFIAAAANSLVRDPSFETGRSDVSYEFTVDDRTRAELDHTYFSPVDNGNVVARTQPNQERPAASGLHLRMTRYSDQRKLGGAATVSVFDAPGEGIGSAEGVQRFAPFVSLADVAILFLDPTSIPGLLTDESTSPLTIDLGRLNAMLGGLSAVSARKKAASLFVVLSKADLFAEHAAGAYDHLSQPDLSTTAAQELVEEIVRKFLPVLHTRLAADVVRVKYRCASAIGGDPEAGFRPAFAGWGCGELLLDAIHSVEPGRGR